MSYILDALKKLEHEKTKKSRAGGMVNLSGELFENERPGPESKAGWKIAIAVVVAILVTFTLTWKFIPTGRVVKKSLPGQPPQAVATPASSAVPVPQPEVRPVPAPAIPIPAPSTVSVPTAATKPAPDSARRSPVAVIPQSTKTVLVPVAQSVRPSQSMSPAVVTGDDAAALLTQQELRRRLKDRKGSSPPLPLLAPPPDIKLSGIAFQDERRARRAVVNGFLMQEGSVVSGAIITDIYQDRVRFTQGGGIFELTLSSSAVPMPGK